MAKDLITEIDGRPIHWTDADGVVHRCEGADIHPGIRLLWTRCERDVPADSAYLPATGDKVTCTRCLA
jgi:hypothetical protein